MESREPLTKVGKPLKKLRKPLRKIGYFLGKPFRKIGYFPTYLIYSAIIMVHANNADDDANNPTHPLGF